MSKENLNDAQQQIMQKLYDAVIEGSNEKSTALAQECLDAGIPPITILDDAMTVAIREVGERFNRMEVFLPEMVTSAEAMEEGVKILQPHFDGKGMEKKGKIVLGTIKGDIHDIGKNIYKTLLQVNGYDVIDLGRDVPPTDFIDEAESANAQIIAISGLLTTSLPLMRDTVEMVNDSDMKGKIKVIIGGGPTSQEYAERIGADGYGNTAQDGVALCDRLLGFAA